MADVSRMPATTTEKVIGITRHGRVIGGYLSAGELEHYKPLKHRKREVLVLGDLDDDTVADLENAEYGVTPQ